MQLAGIGSDRLRRRERRGRIGKVSAQELDDAEVIPVAVDGRIDFAAAREVGISAIEVTD
ncbi:MAG: hypothetical protein K2Y23_11555 [Cyanobacteria bacterium]|nr:hypothetical protein [Cyanobacteriota bacterium]